MYFGFSKKIISSIILLVNLIPTVNASNFYRIKDNKNTSANKIIWSKLSSGKNKLIYKNSIENKINLINQLLAASGENKDELTIQSETQSEKNNTLYAEGNVVVSYKGKFLTADSLIYDKSRKKISASGNIYLIVGDQIFKMSEFNYDFLNEKGSLLDVVGSIKTDKLVSDIFANFSNSDLKRIEGLIDLKRKEIINTPNKVRSWVFSTDEITIDGNKWKTKKAIFTNDLLELKQVKIVIKSLEAFSSNNQLRFKSSLNYLTLDEKVSIPFWFGNRTLTKNEEDFNFQNRWTSGYDNLDKDGYFIGRRFNSINLFDDFVLDLEPQFLFQRSLIGSTKSFTKKGALVTSEKIKRDTSFADYFALNSQIKGTINNWDLKINKKLNSFDFDKLSDAVRIETSLSKEISFFNSKWDKTFYGIYRDRVWNGSIGESEIYEGYGSKLEKENSWEQNGIIKTELFSFGLANLKGESLETKDIESSIKGNIFYSFEQKIPILFNNPSNQFIDNSFEYIPKPINKGLYLNTKFSSLYALYEYGHYQTYLSFGAGPEFVYGDFKNKFFDYTRISLMPSYKLKSGESIFKFDQVSEKFILDMAFDQQIYGPFMISSNATLNLDHDSKDYGNFINSRISINWKKRSYEFGIFYQPYDQSGGVSFNLFGFN